MCGPVLLYLCVLVCVLAVFRLLVQRGKKENETFRKEVDFHRRQGMARRDGEGNN